MKASRIPLAVHVLSSISFLVYDANEVFKRGGQHLVYIRSLAQVCRKIAGKVVMVMFQLKMLRNGQDAL